jgi:hypothetical protein
MYLRAAAVLCAGLLVWPTTTVRLVGVALAMVLFTVNWLQARRSD